jgi:hypothetical protein
MTISKEGRRYYILGDTYAIKDRLRNAGCKWDPDRRAWWTGKEAVANEFAGAEPAKPAEKPPAGDDTKLVGKARYKGRIYYIAWMGRTAKGTDAARLVTMDGKLDFWKDLTEIEVVKHYRPLERTFRGHTHTEHMTLGKIRRFVEGERENREAGGDVCAECGRSGELVADLEDGMLKHRRCRDIEPM